MQKIKIGIVGFGKIGHAVLSGLKKTDDMELVGILTRRPEVVAEELGSNEKVFSIKETPEMDVVILCGGSAKDTPIQGPEFAQLYNTVDSFDNHADIPTYFQKMKMMAEKNKNTSIVSVGWDPEIFSLERVIGEAFIPKSNPYTFWGNGVSQGHTNAAKSVAGVVDAIQYTIPIQSVIEEIRAGKTPILTAKQKHKRLVYVVSDCKGNEEKIEETIKRMPKYFDPYNVEVKFITQEEMNKNHSNYPHGGFVLTSGQQGGKQQTLEYSCKLGSNPNFTANILIAFARVAYRLNKKGEYGAFTILDVPLGLLSTHSGDELRKKFV